MGTPLVTYLGEDPINGADINTAVLRLLSPLKRTCPTSAKVHSGKENGFADESIEEPSSHNLRSLSMDNAELVETSGREFSFQLFIAEGSSCKLIEKGSFINSGQVVKVFLEWTDTEIGLYDISYLKDLPEVQKTGFTVKKTRQEAISLFTCLEAFLTKEPLGPDDMWYITLIHLNDSICKGIALF